MIHDQSGALRQTHQPLMANQSLRILAISNRYPPHYTGGYEIACQTVIERLKNRGHEIIVLTSNYGLQDTAIDGHVHRILHRPQDSPDLFELARWELADHTALSRTVDRLKPEVIYAWSMMQLFPSLQPALRKLTVPVVFNIQDIWLPRILAESNEQLGIWNKPGGNLFKQIAKTSMRTILKWRHPQWLNPMTPNDIDLGHVVFCSQFRREEHTRAGLPLGDSRVIYNGIDHTVFNGNASSSASGRLKVLFVGRLVHEKGAHTVIEAIAEMARRGYRKVDLSVAGVPAYPWEYSANLHEMVKANNLGDRVRFLGMIQNHELPDVYREHDVLVFPSLCDEGFPVTLIEAMACGIAVIGTTTGGSSEILEDRLNSLTFPPGDGIALADRLSRLLDHPDLARSLAATGQSLVQEKFDIERITDQTEEYLKEVAQSSSKSGSN